MNARITTVLGIVAGLLTAPAASAQVVQRWSAPEPRDLPHRMQAIDPADGGLLEKVSAKRRQSQSEALRLKLRLARAAKVTVRLHSKGTRWRPLGMKARKGANRVRINGGEDRSFPTGRYRVKVSARAGDVVSEPWTLRVHVVR